jgi:hypothetical protein
MEETTEDINENIIITDSFIDKFKSIAQDIKTYLNSTVDISKYNDPNTTSMQFMDPEHIQEILAIRKRIKVLASSLENKKYSGKDINFVLEQENLIPVPLPDNYNKLNRLFIRLTNDELISMVLNTSFDKNPIIDLLEDYIVNNFQEIVSDVIAKLRLDFLKSRQMLLLPSESSKINRELEYISERIKALFGASLKDGKLVLDNKAHLKRLIDNNFTIILIPEDHLMI